VAREAWGRPPRRPHPRYNGSPVEAALEALGSPADVLIDHGFRVRGRSVRCPFHADSDPSMALFTGDDGVERWWCHACDFGGSAIDLVARLTNRTVTEVLDAYR
jgi:hypothetical protein